MIFEFNGNKPENHLSIIKMSFSNKTFHLTKQYIKSNNNIIKLNVYKKKFFSSIKLKY